MPRDGADDGRTKLLKAGTELFRRRGFGPAAVDDICQHADVTKGAFFHHFDSKEALARACLEQWDCSAAAMEQAAGFQTLTDPLARLLGYLDFYIALFENPGLVKSCLAGTTVQEVSQTHPNLRDAANVCFIHAQGRLQKLLDHACKARRRRLNTASLAALWMAAVQGSLILHKASQDDTVIVASLKHVRQYIRSLFATGPSR